MDQFSRDIVARCRTVAAALAIAAALHPLSVAAQLSPPVPVPRPKPPEIGGPPAAPAPQQGATKEEEKKEEGPTADEACLERLKALGVQFETASQPASSNTACAIGTPIRLKAVAAASRAATVRLPDEPILSCRFGERLSQWIGDLAAPLIAARAGAELKAVRTGPGFECRNRNRAAAGRLSAHALGIAVDVATFELANGRALPVKPDGDERARATVEALRTAACGWFTTVLGPGSDAAHTDHLHLDIQPHGSSDRYRICQ